MRILSTLILTAALATYMVGCGSAETGADMTGLTDNSKHSEPHSPSYDMAMEVGGAMDGGDWEQQPSPPAPSSTTNETEKYEAPGTNPYVIASADPLSTFAADVDTASYELFRRDVGSHNILPHKDGVRLEEYVNYFAYDYEAPAHDSETPFAINMEAAQNPFVEGTSLLRIGIKGKKATPEEKKPANLVFLVDVSGSMSHGLKLDLVKKVLNETLEILEPTDTISIVTYASGTGVRLEPTPVSQKSTIIDAVNSMKAGGGTNGAGGIQLAYEQAADAFIEDGINHVMLCTDGDFNIGISGDDALVEFIEEKRKTGVTLTVLGFGMGNLNDSMMEKVSNAGNGVYGVISDHDQAISYVHKRMLSNLQFIAKDMKLQIEFNPAKVHAYRLLGYENRKLEDWQFKDDKVDAGEIGVEHTVTALYELVLVGDSIPEAEGAPEIESEGQFDDQLEVSADELALVKIRYKDVDATEEDPAYEVNQGLLATELKSELTDATSDFQWVTAIAAFAEILKSSPYGTEENLEQIKVLTTANENGDPDREEFNQLLETTTTLLAEKAEKEAEEELELEETPTGDL